MLKKLKVSLVFALLGIAGATAFLVWFLNVPGVHGLLYWHPNIQMIVNAFIGILIAVPVLFLVTLLVAKKKVLGAVFAVLTSIAGFAGFAGGTALMLNYIPAGKRLPKNYTKVQNPFLESAVKELYSIAISSDPHWHNEKSNPQETQKILEKVGNRAYDAFFCLGDVSDYGDTKDGYEAPVKAFNERLKGIPLFAMMGNHDALTAATDIFNTIFYGDKNHEQYYRMDYGDLHFIVLDLLWGAEDCDQKQINWLVEQLESIPQEEKVVVLSHAFFVSSGYVDEDFGMNWFDNPLMMEKFCPIFEKYKVDLVISGHNHLMELLEKDGVTYAIIGAMGGKLDNIEYKSPYSLWCNNEAFGFIDMYFGDENKISFAFFDSNGRHLKSYEVLTK